mmetsp:Transcript_12132/g.16758  ORF Transcript_12132/g.16758 Transcript_12132/m.16758 type:complete len:139 (-) Transcript_12132:52-468(-)|eukprot:CAMPEP_0185742328 /NCGR_PEP_ID=MMETSP1171-20130828/39424_1 /TAXON_ID=374046 /ORGANISM="Helicotheca tamensis, Strain CCMP826" /LENGTH=138 /DNA_ID=CAMNT_0028414341 /DNA_START=163 /DNA_END=579 /DNA_ORIENTATION=-
MSTPTPTPTKTTSSSCSTENESMSWVYNSLCAIDEFKEEGGLGGYVLPDNATTACWFCHPSDEDDTWEDTVILKEENDVDIDGSSNSNLSSNTGNVSRLNKGKLVLFVDTVVPMDEDGDETLTGVLLDVLCDCACLIF